MKVMKTIVGSLRLVRSWRVLGLVLALLATGRLIMTTQPALGQTGERQDINLHQRLDDLFAAVAQRVPEFGGMFYGPDEQTLQVIMTDPGKLAAAQRAIIAVFGATVIPQGGVKALKGQRGFLQLKKQYDRMVGPVLSIQGVTFTDINEAKNRLEIGVETSEVEARVVKRLRTLDIEDVAIKVTGPVEPLMHTVTSSFSPRQGGYILTRLFCNRPGTGFDYSTLGFNAVALKLSGNVTGFVINSHFTARVWDLDTNVGFPPAPFYQSAGLPPPPQQLIGEEAIDPPGFQGFPCPSGLKCRYSDSAFVRYLPKVASDHALVAETTGITTSVSNPILTVEHGTNFNDIGPGIFGIDAPPSKPYLMGLTLNKVGSRTGWTQGSIMQTSANYPFPAPHSSFVCGNGLFDPAPFSPGTLLFQYVVGHPINDVVDVVNHGDSGAPVFRISKERSTSSSMESFGAASALSNSSSAPLAARHTNQLVFKRIWGRSITQTHVWGPIPLARKNGSSTDVGHFQPLRWPCSYFDTGKR